MMDRDPDPALSISSYYPSPCLYNILTALLRPASEGMLPLTLHMDTGAAVLQISPHSGGGVCFFVGLTAVNKTMYYVTCNSCHSSAVSATVGLGSSCVGSIFLAAAHELCAMEGDFSAATVRNAAWAL